MSGKVLKYVFAHTVGGTSYLKGLKDKDWLDLVTSLETADKFDSQSAALDALQSFNRRTGRYCTGLRLVVVYEQAVVTYVATELVPEQKVMQPLDSASARV